MDLVFSNGSIWNFYLLFGALQSISDVASDLIII